MGRRALQLPLVALLVLGVCTNVFSDGKMISQARKLLRSKEPFDRKKGIDLLVQADSKAAIVPLEDAVRRSRKDMEKLAKSVDELDLAYVDAAHYYRRALATGDTNLIRITKKSRDLTAAAWRASANLMGAHLSVVLHAGASMAKFRSPGAVGQIDRGAKGERDALIRQMYVEALGSTARVEFIPTLIELLEHGDARVRSLAARSLRPHVLRKPVLAALKSHAEDKSWSVRLSICETMARAPFEEAVPFLVQAMSREKGQMAMSVDALLHSLTGRTFAGEPRSWAAWWSENKKGILDGSYERPTEAKTGGGHTVSTFFAIPVISKNVLFVVDFSGSMDEKFSVDDQHMRDNLMRYGLPETRLGYAVAEISKALRELPEDAKFNVIAYGDEPERFARKPQKATKSSRDRAVKWLRKRETQWLTNIWGALRESFGDHLDNSGGRRTFTELPDTIIFLTDGIPSRGRYQRTGQLRILVDLWNKAAGAVIHTVGIGEQHEKDLLLALARDTHGFYVDLSKGAVSLKAHPLAVPENERRPHFAREVRLILKDLEEGDWEERLAAVRRVAKLGPWGRPAVKHVGAALADDDSDVADAAVNALIAIGIPAVKQARDRLGHEDYEVVVRALRVLRGLGTEALPALQDIITALDHHDSEVKVAALRALAAMGKKAAPALERLKACLANEDDDVQKAAKRAVTSIEGG